eukprot:Rhum_TRINITY_DN15443_c3_g3::Rhum_TRINITY_DN15443_c3_g3_i16::g.157293::m.157293
MADKGTISCDPFFARSVPWYNAYAKKGHSVRTVRLRTCFSDDPECVADALTYSEGDLTLTESVVVLRYVVHKDAAVPTDAKTAARMDDAIATVLAKAGKLSSEIIAPLFFVKNSRARVAKGIETVQPILQYYETLLSTQDYVAGDRLSLADFVFAPEVDQLLIVAPALQTQPLDGQVAIAAYLKRMRQVDGYTAGFEAAKAHFDALQVPEKLAGNALESAHFVDAVDDEFVCSLCLEIFVAPMQCKQGHVFCKACIERTLKKKEECPMDRSRLQVADLSRALLVENMISRKRVRCPHASQHTDDEDGCGWVGKVSERQKHLADECEHTLVPCPHDGCEVRVQRRMVMEHAASCEQRVEACELCSVGVVVAHHAQHEEECPMGTVVCRRLGCEALSRRKDAAAHEDVCPMVQVECVFEECGCTVGTLLRKDVAGHERDAAAVHAALALQESKSRTNETAQLRKEISALTKETAKLKPETVSLKQEVRTLQAELRRNAEAATKPVSVKWRVENIEAKLASCDEFSSKEIRIQSAAGPQTPLCFLAIIKFKKEAGEMSLYFQSICDNPTDLKGTSATLCNADADKNGGLERTFTTDALLPGYASWGWPKFVSFAELRESHV